jgi:Spy/CpxP family protein refolding chaperone
LLIFVKPDGSLITNDDYLFSTKAATWVRLHILTAFYLDCSTTRQIFRSMTSVTAMKGLRQICYMNLKTLVLPIFGAIAVASFQAQAQEATTTASPSSREHHHWRHHHAWFWKKLNLTESQRAYIKQLRQNDKATIQPALLLVLKDHQVLQQAIAGNETASIPSAATKLGTDQGALISARSTLRAQILNYIMTSGTTEQKNLLSEWQQKKATWLQDKINRLSSNSGS